MRRIVALGFTIICLLTFTAAAPADVCACGHDDTECVYIAYANPPYMNCYSPYLGWHRH